MSVGQLDDLINHWTVKWTARIILIPAAIPVTGLLAFHLFTTMRAILGIPQFPEIYTEWQGKLTPEQQFIFAGDPKAKTDRDRQKPIADRWPDNPIYYGNYAVAELDTRSAPFPNEMELNQFLAIFDRGEKLESQNAFYNFMKAAILLKQAARVEEESSEYTFLTKDRSGKIRKNRCIKTIITHQGIFERGLVELRKGLAKPYCTSHTTDMLKYRLNLLPPTESLRDFIQRTTLAVSVIHSDLSSLRYLAKCIDGYALDMAGKGNKEETINLLDGVAVLGTKVSQNASIIVEVLAGRGIRNFGLGHVLCAYEKLGLLTEARQAQTLLEEEDRFFIALYNQNPEEFELYTDVHLHGGILSLLWAQDIPGYRFPTSPIRRAEYILFGEMALLVFLLILIWIIVFQGLTSLVLLIRYRSQLESPKLLFVGVKPLAKILFLSTILPIGFFILYSVLPFSGREYGIPLTAKRLILEYTLVGITILALLFCLSYSAIRKRAQEAGIPIPPPRQISAQVWFIVPGILIVLSAIVAIAGWQLGIWRLPVEAKPFEGANYFFYLSGLVALFTIVWDSWDSINFNLKEFMQFKRTYIRSLVPIFSLAAIFLGLICGQGLIKSEGFVLRHVAIPFINEIENSCFSKLKDRYIQQHHEILTEYLKKSKGL